MSKNKSSGRQMEDYGSIASAFDTAGVKTWELLTLSSVSLASKVGRSVNEINKYKKWYETQVRTTEINTIDATINPILSTGILDLDNLLGGGLTRPSVTEISGTATVGKTCLCCQVALQNVGSAIYFTTEDKFSTILRRMGDMLSVTVDGNSSSVFPPDHFFNIKDLVGLRIALATLRKRVKDVSLIIIDSLGELLSPITMPQEVQIELEELQLRKIAHELQAAIVIVNHVSEAKRPRNGHTTLASASSSNQSNVNMMHHNPYSLEEVPSFDYRMQSYLVEGDSAPDRDFQVRPKHAMTIADFIDTRLVLMRLRSRSPISREARIIFSRWASPAEIHLEMTESGLRAEKKVE